MPICTFFGHSFGFYSQYKNKLIEVLVDLIENKNTDIFYLGNRGDFDMFCTRAIKELKLSYPHIKIYLLLAYMPKQGDVHAEDLGYNGSIYLLEKAVPPRFAIIETNKCAVDTADFIISGVYGGSGGAFQAINYAKKKHKNIITLCDDK